MATQTGSIDLTASNSVKLMAEAGFESVEENYYTKAELDVTVQGINTEVSKKVNGTEIISTINQSAESVSIDASKINLTGAVTISDLASDAQSATLNSNISVGGRNLLRNTGNPTSSDLAFTRSTVEDGIITVTPTTSAGYAKFVVDYLDFDDYGEGQYTFSFDAKAVSGATYTQLKGPVAYAGFNVASRMSNASFSSSYDRYKSWTLSPTLTYDWTRYTQTFTVPDDLTTGQASALASGSNLTVVVAMTGSYAPMQVRNVKLEKGNVATDWSPAPEDVDAAISDAAKTATSYVTEITGQNGIMVHPSTNQTTGVQITSDVDILRGCHTVINVGTQGDTSGNTNAGVTIYDGTANENVVATFAGDGIGLAGDAFHLTSTKTTTSGGDENIVSNIGMKSTNSSYGVRSLIYSDTSISSQAQGLGGYMGLSLAVGDSTFDDIYANPTIYMYATSSSSALTAAADEVDLIAAQGQIRVEANECVLRFSNGGSNTWSTAAGTVIWSSSGWAMAANVTATLSRNVSTCPSGIVLHWQAYASNATQNYDHVYTFIPKQHVVASAGSGVVCQLANGGFGYVGTKYVYVHDDKVVGHASNTTTGTSNGITYNNGHWVLTQVIAV